MTFSEVQQNIKSGDKIINTWLIRGGNSYDVTRDGKKIFSINYGQFKKLTNGLKCEITYSGLIKHVYTIN